MDDQQQFVDHKQDKLCGGSSTHVTDPQMISFFVKVKGLQV